MNRYTLAVLVKNQFGVLNRLTSMFRRRQFNISSITASETESAEYSRITFSFDGEEEGKQLLMNQLYKLPDVCSIKELTNENSLSCELMLIKLKNDPDTREEIHSAAEAFKAETIDYSKYSIVLRLIGNSRKMDDFISLMGDFTILEICRTGTASIEKGSSVLRKNLNL
ncbi:MAG: acetolactate synthase small subunit [Acutalibacteraceae bacterium]|nr:acetolactate synthase small subunit [Acutalibacteraceae bacterium]MEE1504695.1 acetolactate synthase small subunit [Acutalibacteraceae bacterium]